MLYRLELENFYSVRDAQVLDLAIPPNVPAEEERFAPLFEGSPYRAPKVVAIYGANASGKTTILKALNFLFSFAAPTEIPERPRIYHVLARFRARPRWHQSGHDRRCESVR